MLSFRDEDLYAAIGDDEQCVADIALLEEGLAFAVAALAQHVADPLEFRLGQILKNVDPMQDVDDVPGRH